MPKNKMLSRLIIYFWEIYTGKGLLNICRKRIKVQFKCLNNLDKSQSQSYNPTISPRNSRETTLIQLITLLSKYNNIVSAK